MEPEKERKTIDNVFDSICDFEELYAAYRDARKQKRYRRDVMEYTEQLETNLITTQNELNEALNWSARIGHSYAVSRLSGER